MTEHLKMQTPDGTDENIEKLAELFPSAVTEMRGEDGKVKKGINFETLKQLLSHEIVDGNEHYEFTWVGKKQAMAEAARSTTQTLRPVKEDSRNWDTTENLYIEGDNLEVLKTLQQSYLGKVKMIYIDPPYNTGSDKFTYPDDYSMSEDEYAEKSGAYDEVGNRVFKENNPSNPRFHSDWCSMIYMRLKLARNLLSEDGVIFISIDDNEQENLKKICDEIFGAENFINLIAVNMNSLSGVKMTHAILGKRYPAQKEYLLLYCKKIREKNLFIEKLHKEHWDKEYNIIIPSLKKGQFESFAMQSDEQVNVQLSEMRLESLSDYCKESGIDLTDEWKWNNAYRIFGTKSNRPLAKRIRETKFNNQIVAYTNADGNKRFFRSDFNRDARDPRIELVQAEANSSVFLSDNWIDISNDGGVAQEGEVIFPNGKKPLKLIRRIIRAANVNDGIVLDFFSGSATTAHAVMQLNAEDGGHRKFIMVQLPELCDEKSEAYKAGYKNICEIGKERIRRAGDKIKAEHPDAEVDTGFRVFRVDSSNMKDVYFHPEEVTQTMLGETVSNIKPDRTDLDLLYDCMLRCGVEINLPHTTTVVDDCKVHNVDNGALMACFDENVSEQVIRAMAAEQPIQAIFRDSSFATDADKINVTEIFKNLSPDTKVRVI